LPRQTESDTTVVLPISASPTAIANISGILCWVALVFQLLTNRFSFRCFGVTQSLGRNSKPQPGKHHHIVRSPRFHIHNIISEPDCLRPVLYCFPSAMALIDRVPGDLDLYIGGYVTVPSRLDACSNRFATIV